MTSLRRRITNWLGITNPITVMKLDTVQWLELEPATEAEHFEVEQAVCGCGQEMDTHVMYAADKVLVKDFGCSSCKVRVSIYCNGVMNIHFNK